MRTVAVLGPHSCTRVFRMSAFLNYYIYSEHVQCVAYAQRTSFPQHWEYKAEAQCWEDNNIINRQCKFSVQHTLNVVEVAVVDDLIPW